MSVPKASAVLASVLAFCSCSHEKDPPPALVALHGDLEPIESALTYHSPAYHGRLREVLIDKAPRPYVLQFLIKPSFEPETLLSLYRVDGRYEAQVRAPEVRIWGAEGGFGNIECKEAKKQVPAQTAERLCRVWNQMLVRTKRSMSDYLAFDGESYAFMGYQEGLGYMSGETSNPEQGTRPHVLAGIGEAMVAYVLADPASEHVLLANVTTSLDGLEASLATK